MLETILALLVKIVPLALPSATSKVMEWLRAASLKIEAMPKGKKRWFVAGIAAVLTLAKHLFGVELPTDLASVTTDLVQWVLTTLAAFGLHAIQKDEPAK